jgi:anti-sigma B factor antagonist
MEINSTELKRCDLIEVSGRVDSATADELMAAINAIQDDGRYKIVLDLGGLDFMASKGWWTLIQAQKASKRYNRGEVLLANVPKMIQENLDLVGISKLFRLFDDPVEAVGSF